MSEDRYESGFAVVTHQQDSSDISEEWFEDTHKALLGVEVERVRLSELLVPSTLGVRQTKGFGAFRRLLGKLEA